MAKFLAEVISDLDENCARYLSTDVPLLGFKNAKSNLVQLKAGSSPWHLNAANKNRIAAVNYGLISNKSVLDLIILYFEITSNASIVAGW